MNVDWDMAVRGVIGAACGVALIIGPLPVAAWVLRQWGAWRLHHHHCPLPCRESIKCRCGCGHYMSAEQVACGLCGAAIVRDDEEFDGPYSMGPGLMNVAGSPDEDMDRDDDRDWGPYR